MMNLQSTIQQMEKYGYHLLRQRYHHLYFMLSKEKKWLEDVNQRPFMSVTLNEMLAPHVDAN